MTASEDFPGFSWKAAMKKATVKKRLAFEVAPTESERAKKPAKKRKLPEQKNIPAPKKAKTKKQTKSKPVTTENTDASVGEDADDKLGLALMTQVDPRVLAVIPTAVSRPILRLYNSRNTGTSRFVPCILDQLDTPRLLLLFGTKIQSSARYSTFFEPLSATQTKDEKPKPGGLNLQDVPRSSIYDIFAHMAEQAHKLGLDDALPSRKLRVVTMCSGTESPLLAMNLIQQGQKRHDLKSFEFVHLASAEIIGWKQAFIQRNFEPKIIFADVTDFLYDGPARTAYGGTAPLPRDVDILIAGASCVSFSSLNSKRRTDLDEAESLEKASQSERTLAGIRAYAAKAHPRIIILENVNLAPWSKVEKYFEDIGYCCKHTKVDTKNYYLPQTRRRGYLIAFEATYLKTINFNIDAALKSWVKFMDLLRCRASAPFTDFLLDDNDQHVEEIKRSYVHAPPANTTMDWAKSRHRYAKFRVERLLGVLRPLTQWQDNGSCKFPSFGWIAWAKKQRERIWDTLDLEYLRHIAERDYDMNYKSRWLDVSQNIDRDEEGRQWGLVSCVTPEGIFYLSSRGGLVTGVELLALQGLPVRDINLSRETSKQLQDLAGNAMSSTVIGAAILSALLAANAGMKADGNFFPEICGAEASNNKAMLHMSEKASEATEIVKVRGSWTLVRQQINIGSRSSQPVAEILAEACKTIQLCKCEGSLVLKQVPFLVCEDCGHTSCAVCAGNPPHRFRHLDLDPRGSTLSPRSFATKISQVLPAVFHFSMNNVACFSEHIILARGSNYKGCLEAFFGRALNSSVYFRDVKRAYGWKITYEGPHSRLELHLIRKAAPDLKPQSNFFAEDVVECFWLLYAKPDSGLGLSDKLSEAVEQPLARLNPSKHSNTLWEGEWDAYSSQDFEVHIEAGGDAIPAFEQQLGLEHSMFKDLMTTSELKMSVHPVDGQEQRNGLLPTLGTYKKIPKCGGASGSLYVRINAPPESDDARFLFLDPKPLQNACFDSYVFSSTNHKLSLNEYREVVAKIHEDWRPIIETTGDSGHRRATAPLWIPRSALKSTVGVSSDKDCAWVPKTLATEVFPPPGACASALSTILLVRLPWKPQADSHWKKGERYPLRVTGNTTALDEHGWIIKRAANNVPNLGVMFDIPFQRPSDFTCNVCTPEPPTIEYTDVRVYANTTKGGAPKIEVRPVEDAIEATAHEAALKARPEPASAAIHCHETHAYLDVKLNVITLCHRALSKVGESQYAYPHVAWKLEHDDYSAERHKYQTLKLLNNLKDPALEGAPPGFQRPLWEMQKKPARWLLKQDQEPPEWYEKAREEISIPTLGLRAVAEATLARTVRGGLLADEVGSGKTTVALSLIANSLAADRACATAHLDGRTHIHATLILVPFNIINQWEIDITECWIPEEKPDVIKIQSMTELSGVNDARLEKADIILVAWDIFDEMDYWMALQTASGARNVPPTAGRALDDWLENALKDLRQRNYHHPASASLDGETRSEGLADNLSNVLVDPSNHATAQKYYKYKDLTNGDSLPDKLQSATTNVLHKFCFRRLITDEYTYLQGKSHLAVRAIVANSKFLLSGTPSLGTFAQVDNVARLLCTRLRPDDEKDGRYALALDLKTATTKREDKILKDQKKTAKDVSNAEDFHSHELVRSGAWYKARNELADAFVKKFVRQNPTTPVKATCHHHYIVDALSATEQLHYFEVYQQLMSQGTTFGVKYAKGDLQHLGRDDRLQAAIKMSRGPEEALLTCCSTMRLYNGDAAKECRIMVDQKSRLIFELGMQIRDDLREAFFYENARQSMTNEKSHLLSYVLRVINNQIGDTSTAALIDVLLRDADLQKTKPDGPYNQRREDLSFWDKPVDEMSNPEMLAILEQMQLSTTGSRSELTVRIQEQDARRNRQVPSNSIKNAQQKAFSASVKPPTGGTAKQRKADEDFRLHEMKTRAEALNIRTISLVKEVRRWRFFDALLRLLEGEELLHCDGCRAVCDGDSLSLLGICGHMACSDCLTSSVRLRDNPDGCVVNGCDAPGMAHHMIPASVFSPGGTSTLTRRGSKVTAVIDAIHKIKQENKDKDKNKDEKIIVFVQFPEVAAALIEALNPEGISYIDATSGMVRNKVESFKRPVENPEDTIEVLILQIDSPDAAGWNIQEANHIMFPSTYVAPSKYQYKSTMKQAIGRAFRCLQQNDVHVYHFLMAKTVEVNILQDQENKVIVKRHGQFSRRDQFTLDERTDSNPGEWEGSSIQGAICAAGDVNNEDMDDRDADDGSDDE